MPLVASPAARTCPYCHSWWIGADDLYCSSCGELSLEFEIRPQRPILVESVPTTHHRRVVLTNKGTQDLEIEVRVEAQRPWLRLEPDSLSLPAQRKARIDIFLDPSLLPDDFRTEHLPVRLVLNGNPDTTKTFSVITKAGPKPRAEPVQFGELQEGTVERRYLVVCNDGGIPCELDRIEVQGEPQLAVDTSRLPVKVSPEAAVRIPVSWDTTASDDAIPEAGFRLFFSHGVEIPVRAHASLYRYRLEAEPSRLRLTGTRKRTVPQRVVLRNLGTIDVEIQAIEASEAWLEVNVPLEPWILTAPSESGDSKETTLALTVHCRAKDLEPGIHRAQLEIKTGDDSDLNNRIVDIEFEFVPLEEYHDYIGIDFGTTNSVVSVLDLEEQPSLVEIGDELSSALIPSLLFFEEDGTTHIGSRAHRSSRAYPERAIRSIKRVMGYEEGVRILDQVYQPEEIAARILEHLVAYAEEHLQATRGKHADIRRAIVTVPANFFDLQIRAILKACELAGIETDRDLARRSTELLKESLGHSINSTIILDEPSAAALYFVYYLAEERSLGKELEGMVEREEGVRVLVYDHGGGTLDISVAQAKKLSDGSVGIRILATKGDNHLGGDHLDILLMRDLLVAGKAFESNFDESLITSTYREIEHRRTIEGWSDQDWKNVVRARQEWKGAAEEIKISLGSGEKESVTQSIAGNAICYFEEGRLVRSSGTVQLEMTFGEMASRLSEPLQNVGVLIEKALELAELEPADIDFVFHAGRQSLLKLVEQHVSQIFERLPQRDSISSKPASSAEHKQGPEIPAAAPFKSPAREKVASPKVRNGPGVGRIIVGTKDLMKFCVAKGAALYGQFRDANNPPFRLIQEPKLPHSYGISRRGTLGKLELKEILPRGEIYPLSREEPLEELPSTGRLHFKIYQNTGLSTNIRGNPDMRPIGNLEHRFDPETTDSLTLELAIDASRLLTAQIGEHGVKIRPLPPSDDLDWMG